MFLLFSCVLFPTHTCFTFILSRSLGLGDGDDNRPGMRGGHQMVIDVQTGTSYVRWFICKVSDWLVIAVLFSLSCLACNGMPGKTAFHPIIMS